MSLRSQRSENGAIVMPFGPSYPALNQARRLAEANLWIQQFGQDKSDSAWGGATACTHTAWQFLALLWLGARFSINQISTLAGYPYKAKNSAGVRRGMYVSESRTLIAKTELPYRVVFDATYETLLKATRLGPVLYATRYGSQPDQRGYVYKGVRADGNPNGYAIRNGRTQLTGFENGAHMVVLLGYRALLDDAGNVKAYYAWRKDPNHGSAARPERPPYDVIYTGQGKREYNDYKTVLGRARLAIIPTRALV